MIRSENQAQRSRRFLSVGGYATKLMIWLIGTIAIVVLLAYNFLLSPKGREITPEVSKAGHEIKGSKGSADWKTDIPGERQSQGDTVTGGPKEGSSGHRGSPATAGTPRRNQPSLSYYDTQQLIRSLAQMKPRHGKFSPEEIQEINRLLQELKRSGLAGSMAIREFLESGQDVSFAQYAGKIPPEYASLRLALIDALAQIGGSEAAAFMAGMLHTTSNPEEIALLAKGLEQTAPGAYRADILKVARTMLDQALKAAPGQYPGLGHLFGMIQEYGDESIAVDLENMYRSSPSTFTEFALMALSKLPEGYGIPSLVKIVNEMSGNPAAYGMTYDMALRYLTQASREYPEAGKALLSLATANKISTAGLIQIANALGGTEHQLITKSSNISLQSRAETKITLRAAETWTDTEINQRLVLIDQLLNTNPQTSAAKALQDARNRLLIWKERPMVGGRRVKR